MKKKPWKILVCDEFRSVKKMLESSVEGFEVGGRPFAIYDAGMVEKARKLLGKHAFAVAFFSKTTGEKLIPFLRDRKKNVATRILSRIESDSYDSSTFEKYSIRAYPLEALDEQIVRSALVEAVQTHRTIVEIVKSRDSLLRLRILYNELSEHTDIDELVYAVFRFLVNDELIASAALFHKGALNLVHKIKDEEHLMAAHNEWLDRKQVSNIVDCYVFLCIREFGDFVFVVKAGETGKELAENAIEQAVNVRRNIIRAVNNPHLLRDLWLVAHNPENLLYVFVESDIVT